MDSLKENINQLFILGYEGDDFRVDSDFVNLLQNGLGGVIFFTQNIIDEKQFKNQVNLIKSVSKIMPFLSIDEEGGRVERFENLNKNYTDGKKYLSAKYIAQKGELALKKQTQNIADDLKNFGLNMNFAPVLDVNSNPDNPIIGERSYSDNPKEVAKYALITDEIYRKNKIITVGKHFPGHGDTKKDSHLEMPVVDMPFEEFEKTHIYPFKKAVEKNIPAIMAAHVHYKCFDEEKIPASISKNVLNYLRKNLNYQGVIISDDMEMGGIKQYEPIDAIEKMLMAGVNCFIFRNCTKEVVELLKELERRAKKNNELKKAIISSCQKIYKLKKIFDIITL